MKNIFSKSVLLGVVALVSTSCNDSFLERTPTNDLNSQTFWNTTADLQSFCNGIYNAVSDNAGTDNYNFILGFTNNAYNGKTNSVIPIEAMSDNYATVDGSQTWASAIAAGLETIPSNYNSPLYGGWVWTALHRINTFMDNYDKVKVASTTEVTLKKGFFGEASLFRAWFYLDKVQKYGDVPLITHALTTDSPELYVGRTPRKDVMAQVLIDIDNACKNLPDAWPGNLPNRVTRGTALALKARICLYEGTYRKYHNLSDKADYESWLEEAVSAAEECMTLGYKIYDTGNPDKDYATLFTSDDLEGNPEMIMYRKYAKGLLMHRQCGYIINIRAGGTKDFADDFLCKEPDGTALPTGLSLTFDDSTPEKTFANRDPRMAQTFLKPGDQASILNTNMGSKSFPRLGDMGSWPSATGYHLIKYYILEQDKKGYGNETHDAPIIRYAEVLLSLAEAKAELGTLEQTDLDKTINVLRDRVDMPHMTLNPPMDPTYADLGISSDLVEIRRERRVELSFENLRYQDLMRWAQGDKLKERVLGIRFEDSDYDNERYIQRDTEGKITGRVYKPGDPAAAAPVYTYEVDGKHYVDVYAGTNYAAEKRVFNPKKDYLRPIPTAVRSKNPELGQNPEW